MSTEVLPSRATTPETSVEPSLLQDILRQVSRSFYLSLMVLPRSVRQSVSLAYLFCRAADTIADTRMLPRHQRLQALDAFRRQFMPARSDAEGLDSWRAVPCGDDVKEGERQLLARLPECFRLLARLPLVDQHLIRELVLMLTRGMQMDLRSFPGDTASTARALPDMHSLDLYTYYVAGVVGEFWTRIHMAHVPALRQVDTQSLCPLAISFGKGLQLTNILKDLGKDMHHGRCYLPEKQLGQLRVRVGDLRQPETLHRIRPLIQSLVGYTLDHLDRAREYVVRLPRRALRLRLACMWPLLFAVQTLELICRSEHLLHPEYPIKISRYAVYRTLFWTFWCLLWPGLFSGYYRHLRRKLTTTLCKGGMAGPEISELGLP